MSVITLNDGEAVFDCAEGDTLLRAGLRAGLALPYECGVGACGCCRCEVTAGEVANLWPEAPGLSDRDRRKGRVLACQSRPTGDVHLKLRLPPQPEPAIRPVRHHATLVASRQITHDIREFVLRTDAPAVFRPGQYALPSAVVSQAAVPTVGSSGEIMSLPLREAREIFEREYLIAQVERFGGNISKTAAFVGMERSALHRKLKSLGVQSEEAVRRGEP